jgi:exodeoxyribonuclease-3
MKIATWNVNSIRARLDRVVGWVEAEAPDVLCLQETKVEDAAFPGERFEALGYRLALHGQRTYNGVAILSRVPGAFDVVTRGFGDGVEDPQARFLVARAGPVLVASAYVPNGQAVGSEKFVYKLAWLERCRAWLDRHVRPDEAFVLGGDFNVAPDDRDVHDPIAWKDQLHCHPDERAALVRVLAFGLEDLFRRFHDGGGFFSWWDYRQLAFPRNAGLRIDHLFGSAPVVTGCRGVTIDRNARKGKEPSDHAPVVTIVEL